MAHARHPLVGDAAYGSGLRLPKGAGAELTEALRGFRRQALHAERLEFAHPADGRTVAFEAEMPADMAALVEALRRDTRENA
jgi:23S rRNA pseudouridine1911/1915/1917 synthase